MSILSEKQPFLDVEAIKYKPNRSIWREFARGVKYGLVVIASVSILYHCYFISEQLVVRDASGIENYFLDFLKGSNKASEWSEVYTSIPHLAGQGEELVKFTISKFEEFGLDVTQESYPVLLNYPVDNGLKLIHKNESVSYEATLKEDELKDDPTTIGDDLIPSFHGYSASGNVTAQYVYANYGTREDFETLHKLKVDLKDKIVIVRYGKIFRGLKVKFAQESGASGVLIYSDPGDDFYKEKDGHKAYPEGPARNPSSIQRGSVQFLSQMPGDPTTPGYASKEGVPREDPHKVIPKIPSLPVSFKEIEPILKKLNGHGVNGKDIEGSNWVGGLSEFEYFTGPNPDYTVNLYNEQLYGLQNINNVYGTLSGRRKDSFILVGNHRDAWIKGGASDPNSGSASMLETIRAFHELTKLGWKPERTIVFASWDGEEYALLGSTEFGENHSKYLKKHCLAYINLDVSVGGTKLQISSSPLLNAVLFDSMTQVEYPGSKKTLADHYIENNGYELGILGSGSDFTVFQEHLGIPSVDMTFESGENDPVYHYHSNYDSYHWMSTVMDPGFKLHNAMSQYLGLVALKLSNSKVINFDLLKYDSDLSTYFNAISKRVPDNWLSKPLERNHHCHHKVSIYDEMTIEALLSNIKDNLEFLTTKNLEVDNWAQELRRQWAEADKLPLWKRIILLLHIERINLKYFYWERLFLVKEGLTDRPWFKHLVYAAGRDTGYEGFAFPGMKEALDDNNFKEFSKWLQITSKKINLLLKH